MIVQQKPERVPRCCIRALSLAGAPDPAVVESEDEPEQDSLQPNTQPDPIEVGSACFTFFNFDRGAFSGMYVLSVTQDGRSMQTGKARARKSLLELPADGMVLICIDAGTTLKVRHPQAPSKERKQQAGHAGYSDTSVAGAGWDRVVVPGFGRTVF